ncbi:potassium channel family protein [Planococcus antarcticus]|uniref:potassium channel family protein n=1 Tax=Planococcus antarcticus TaxID=161360 RepID=UPI0009F63065|nr:potassium channel family protein [Planococcus antarcticus]
MIFLDILYLVIGILLIVLCIIDFTWTTLWIDGGAGPVTDRLSSFIWRTFRLFVGDHSKSLSLAGPVVLSASLTMWIAILWAGWTLVFAGLEGSISPSHGNDPISWFDRIYFAGYLIFTLGNGDFSPTEGVWQILTVLATGTGMLFITFGVTYLISILSAVTVKRSFSASIQGLGHSAEELVESAWNGSNFHDIDSLLTTYSEQLSSLTAQHIAYPVLHYYHAANNVSSMPTAVVVLDEALSIMGVPRDCHPNQLLLKETQSSVQLYLETLNKSFYKPSKNVPELPDFKFLSNAGIPLVPSEEFKEAYKQLRERRRKLLGVIEADARPWPKR